MKKSLIKSLIFCIALCNISKASAVQPSANTNVKVQPSTTVQQNPSVQPQLVDFASCNKIFNIDSQKLFYLTLSAINANRFTISEIQSKSGYVIFNVWQREFLASIVSIDSKNSMLKITPCNNNYYFPIGIVQNMFKYIELNLATPIEKLPIN